MGGASARFEYYSNRRKQGALPSSCSYNSGNLVTNKGGKAFTNQSNGAYSFGVSRKNMKRLYIDEILDPSAVKAVNNPGPGQHDLSYQWCEPKDSLLNKTSPQFSFAKSTTGKGDHFERQLKKKAAMPGPGHYGGS